MKKKRNVYKSGHAGYNALDTMRHSCSHLLAYSVMELWPKTKLGVGPTTETGFYYDFELPVKISEADFSKIEKKMGELKARDFSFERSVLGIDEAIKRAKAARQSYKEALLRELRHEGETEVSFYQSGSFIDLCRGPHVANVADIGPFKLLSVAGAYWKGSEKNKMLTRIYGTCFATKEELDHFLWQQEEAKKRDHRKIGREQDLFLVSQDIGGGLPIFTPKGKLLRDAVENFIVNLKKERGYQFVWTPHIARSEVYKTSGHWQKYDAMFNPMQLDEEQYVLKPMNCPHHFQVFLDRPRSYRELPMRIAENGTCYRYEKSGELNGLLRVRSVTVDDTHTFVRHDQIASEVDAVLDLVETAFRQLGFSDYHARISVRDPKNPQKYLGKPEIWDKAEAALIAAAKKRRVPYFIGEGEAAFYGPKIDVMVKDSLGREWQLSTCQLDFNQPENFDMNYVGQDGKLHRPAILHIAILGSLERFLGVLIEHYGGAFPLWLAPVQVVIIPIAERHNPQAQHIADLLKQEDVRVEVDSRNEPMQAKIRNATLQKVPYMAIIGDKEVSGGNISARTRKGEDLKGISLEAFLHRLNKEIDTKD